MYRRALAIIAVGVGCGGDRSSDAWLACAASSAAEAMDQAVARYVAQTGQAVTTCSGPTSTLVRQVEAGQPVDVLLAAHPDWAARLAPRAVATADLLANDLVWFAPDRAPNADSLADGCVAVGDPDHVPVGMYAKAALEGTGQWTALAPRITPTADAPAAVQAVRAGVCPQGIAYRTDLRGADDLIAGAAIPIADPIVYPLLLLDDRARPLFTWLSGPDAADGFAAHGFRRP